MVRDAIKGEFIIKVIESFFGKGSFVIFSLFFTFTFTRLYGPELFGQYTYAYTVLSLLMILAKAGLDNGLIYFMPKYGNKYVTLSFLISTLFTILIIFVSYFIINDTFLLLMLPLLFFITIEQLFFAIYRSIGKIKEYYFINSFLSILLRVILLTIFYFTLSNQILGIVLAVYISFITSNVIYFYQNQYRFKKIIYDKKYIMYSLSLVLAAMMSVVIDKIDILMIGVILEKKDVGIYQVASQVATTTSIILVIFNTVFAPKISQLYHTGQIEKLKLIYVKSTRILAFLSFVIIFFISIFSKYILLIFGSAFIDGQIVLILRGTGQFINAAVGSVWLMLAMTGKPKLQMYGNLAACIINVVLNYLLIPIYGVNGAAFASMIAVGFVNILGYILVSRQFKIKVYAVV